jgi:hypothetical protein
LVAISLIRPPTISVAVATFSMPWAPFFATRADAAGAARSRRGETVENLGAWRFNADMAISRSDCGHQNQA